MHEMDAGLFLPLSWLCCETPVGEETKEFSLHHGPKTLEGQKVSEKADFHQQELSKDMFLCDLLIQPALAFLVYAVSFLPGPRLYSITLILSLLPDGFTSVLNQHICSHTPNQTSEVLISHGNKQSGSG